MRNLKFEKINLVIEKKGKNKYHLKFIPVIPDYRDRAFDKGANDIGRKIYIVSFDKKVFYVGETITAIRTRLQGGCNSFNKYTLKKTKENGYGGYQWISEENKHRTLTLDVAIFEKEYEKKFIEAIEGEIVHLIRNETGNWPQFQNEIHFHYNHSKKAIEIAEFICNELKLI